jgi:hypothetical protein
MARKRASLASILKQDKEETVEKPPFHVVTQEETQTSEGEGSAAEPTEELEATLDPEFVIEEEELPPPPKPPMAKVAPAPAKKSKKYRLGKYECPDTPKSQYEKLSVTIPPEMFYDLEDLTRLRRRNKEPFSMSELVREAVAAWLPKQ